MPLLKAFGSKGARFLLDNRGASIIVLRKTQRLYVFQPAVTLKTSSKGLNDALDKFSRRAAGNFDTLGSWNNRLDLQVNIEESIKTGTLIPEIAIDKVAVSSLIGRRKENEDRFRIVKLAPNLFMFAIFDGHGGALAADYTSSHMGEYILGHLERKEKDLVGILHKSFVEVNAAFAKYLYHNYVGELNIFIQT